MPEASTITKRAYDQVLTPSLERCLVDGMVPPLRFVRGRLSLFDLP